MARDPRQMAQQWQGLRRSQPGRMPSMGGELILVDEDGMTQLPIGEFLPVVDHILIRVNRLELIGNQTAKVYATVRSFQMPRKQSNQSTLPLAYWHEYSPETVRPVLDRMVSADFVDQGGGLPQAAGPSTPYRMVAVSWDFVRALIL